MLDRASTFAQPEIVQLLKTKFVPVAIDQANQRRQKDTEGDFYRKIASQGPRSDFNSTTQGFYIANANGKLLLYNNNRDPAKVLRLMQEKLKEFETTGASMSSEPIAAEVVDQRYSLSPPNGGLVVRVRSKVLGGYEPTTNKWKRIFQTALSRDNLWITAEESEQLAGGVINEKLLLRIARFHLVDNTRGEPQMWKENEIRSFDLQIDSAGQITGRLEIESSDGKRGYHSDLFGKLEASKGSVTRFDMIALGDCWGDGPYTRGAPEGKFPLAISFELADATDIADPLPPQGARGWLDGYLK